MPELSRWLARIAGAGLALGALAGVALASRAQVGSPPRGSELRLALRAARARLEICRERTAEELERLPAHLRTREDCEERAIDYRLSVAIDGTPRLERVVSHRGVRHTRPLTVEVGLAVPPGRRDVTVSFEPIRLPELASDSTEISARLAAEFGALAAPVLREPIEFPEGRAVLVTLGEDGVLRVAR